MGHVASVSGCFFINSRTSSAVGGDSPALRLLAVDKFITPEATSNHSGINIACTLRSNVSIGNTASCPTIATFRKLGVLAEVP